jgi:membrane-bound serine protease (ClpP class)
MPVLRRVMVALLLLAAAAVARPVPAQTPAAAAPVVYVIHVEGMIDLGLAPFLARTIREAADAGAAAVVLEINTFGGRVDAAVVMRDALLNAPLRTIAFINQRAISAGALIALACDTIVMVPGGTIGAAMPVLSVGEGESRATDEKTVSYVRKEFRATAEARSRPPAFAEAMVDSDVEIAGVIEKGKLLTLTTAEALQHNVVEHGASTIEAALEAAGLPGATLLPVRQTWAETLVRFLTHPVIGSLLMSLGILALFVEIRTPGFGVPGAIGIALLGLFFWGHWIVALAGWEELLLIGIGIALILLEVFVLPGMTVAGIAGIIALVAGLALSLVGAGATIALIINALGRVAISILIAMGAAFALFGALPRLPVGRRLVLARDMPAAGGYASAPEADRQWLGRAGRALSPLRPAGIADIDGARIDVVSDGGFIEAGEPIEVTRVDGNRIVVRRPVSRQEPVA